MKTLSRFQATQGDIGAFEQLKVRAVKGDVASQAFVALAFENGDGVPKDLVQAVIWYRKAAENGHSLSQAYLGAIYRIGAIVPKDEVQAAMWYRKAAAQGNANAQIGLGTSALAKSYPLVLI